MRIKVEPFLMKKGNRVAKGAIEFDSGILKDWHLIGFTICEDENKGLFVLFPSATQKDYNEKDKTKPFFFLKPARPEQIDELEALILDEYDRMMGHSSREPFNGVKAVTE